MRKRIKAAAAALAAVVLAAVVAKAAATGQTQPETAPGSPEPPAAELPERPEEAAEPESDPAGEAAQPAPGATAEPERAGGLTERQRGLVASYGDLEREVAALLCANVWADETGTATLSFSEEAVAERKEGMADAEGTWAISLAEKADEAAADGSGTTERIVAVVDFGEEEGMVEVTRFHPASGAEQPWKVVSDRFRFARSYTAAVRDAGAFAVVDQGGALEEVCEGAENLEGLRALVAGIAAAEYPTATKAVWDGRAEYDYKANTVTFAFELDNNAASRIRVLHVLGTPNFETDKGAAL